MQTFKLTALASTPAQLMPFDSGRAGGSVQNPLSLPIWISRDPLCPMAPPSIRIPAVNSRGDAGELSFEGTPYEQWFYQTLGAGDFTVCAW